MSNNLFIDQNKNSVKDFYISHRIYFLMNYLSQTM